MIKIFTSVSAFLLGILAQAQTETQTVSKFTTMEIGKNIEVIYTESTAHSINTTDSNVSTQINDGVLKINAVRQTNEIYKVYVFASDISNIKASGDIRVTNQLSARELKLTLDDDATFAGNIKLSKKFTLQASQNATFVGRVETTNFLANLHDNAKACLTGKVDVAQFNADNRTVLLAGNFKANQIAVSADDYATVKIHAPNLLDISVAEMARVTYTGNPIQFKMNENAIAVSNLDNSNIAVATK